MQVLCFEEVSKPDKNRLRRLDNRIPIIPVVITSERLAALGLYAARALFPAPECFLLKGNDLHAN